MPSTQAAALRRATQTFFRRFGALASDQTPCGKPLSIGHAHALMILSEQGELSQQQLGEVLCIDKSNVARLCAKMVEAGHARQQPGPHDGRSRHVSLTERGAKLAAEVDHASQARFATLLEHLPLKRRSQVIEAVELLVAAIDRLREPQALVVSNSGARP